LVSIHPFAKNSFSIVVDADQVKPIFSQINAESGNFVSHGASPVLDAR
jgi:hypothetical protein